MSIFSFIGRAPAQIVMKLGGNAATVILDRAGKSSALLSRLEVNENNGGTQSLTVELYDPSGSGTSYYLGSGNATWKAKAVTAYQSVGFEQGYVVPKDWQVRVTSTDSSGHFDVIGTYVQ